MDKDRTVKANERGRKDFVTTSGGARLRFKRVKPDMDVYIRGRGPHVIPYSNQVTESQGMQYPGFRCKNDGK